MGSGWRPQLVALDVDGTVVDRNGQLPDAVGEAIDLVIAAGVPVVLSTGRAWHGTQPVVDLLGLPPGLSVCSNGAVIVGYPPQEIVKAITFDPRDVIAQVEEFAPGTLIAVEEIGRGYRLNEHFPGGDLTGEMIIEDLEQLSSRPVTRIILRDPTRSVDDFITLANHLGLHGVTYFVGWSAWLDIAPEGVNKATALAEVAMHLGVHAVRRPGLRRRTQRHRDAPLGRPRRGDRRRAAGGAGGRRRRGPDVRRRRPGPRTPPLVRLSPPHVRPTSVGFTRTVQNRRLPWQI